MSLSCITPKLPFDKLDTINYTLHLDHAPSPDFTAPDLQLSVRKDPSDLQLLTKNVARGSVSVIVTINVSGVVMEHFLASARITPHCFIYPKLVSSIVHALQRQSFITIASYLNS